MGLLDNFPKRKTINAETGFQLNAGVSIINLEGSYPFILSMDVIEEYAVYAPYAYIKIMKMPKLGEGNFYFLNEIPLNKIELDTFTKLMNVLSKELEPAEDQEIAINEYVYKQGETIACKYHRSFGKFTERSWKKIFYYVVRELAGYGPLQAMFLDPNIEDISCNGLNSPVYVWHRKYESIPTNVTFVDEQITNDFIVKLAHRSSKHISSAKPLLDAMLADKHRLAATFMKEVSTKGSTFCIRKFRAEPFSVVDLIKKGTLNERMAAYFWLLLEHKMSLMIIGGTGAGKTSMLNAIMSLMSQNDKIVTVEEVPELTPPLENWTQLHTRQSFQFGSSASSSISLFDLMKMSLRYRPDYIIVGEIRGEEAYVLFQALATGHGGLCTMHADSLENAVRRLTSPPMNVSDVYISLMHSAMYIQQVELPGKREELSIGRRLRNIVEIEDFDKYHKIAVWNPQEDTFTTDFKKSVHLKQIAEKTSVTLKEVLEELNEREQFIKDIIKIGIIDQRDIAQKILAYLTKKREGKLERIGRIRTLISSQNK